MMIRKNQYGKPSHASTCRDYLTIMHMLWRRCKAMIPDNSITSHVHPRTAKNTTDVHVAAPLQVNEQLILIYKTGNEEKERRKKHTHTT
mmetsp:Transcript_13276/g.19045  ORF Transcript_13276/g.19045 Transcript_13276/m.19045 type:complete len:89 (-) Transcript_13276:160-426(-)